MGACAAAGLLLAACWPALAGDDPAVSAPTLSVDGSGGSVNGSPSGFASVTGTVPVGHRFGFQLDGAAGKSGDQLQKGVGGHAFWRDPDQALLGVTASWSRIDSADIYRYGLETEEYLGNFTLAPSVGLQRGDANKGTSTSGYASLSGGWYVTDSLKLSLGGTGYNNTRIGFGEVEWQPIASSPTTFFANTGGGNRGHGFAIAGIRYAFGADNSTLKDRERHGDPENIVSSTNPSGSSSPTMVAQIEQAHTMQAPIIARSNPAVTNVNTTSSSSSMTGTASQTSHQTPSSSGTASQTSSSQASTSVMPTTSSTNPVTTPTPSVSSGTGSAPSTAVTPSHP